MAEFAFRTESGVKYLQFGLLNEEDAEDLTKLQPNIHKIHVGFIKDGLVRATARITGDYSETLGLPIDQIPNLTKGDSYEIGFNELPEERTEQGITPVQWTALITAIQGLMQGLTNAAVTATIEAYTRQFTPALLDKLNGIENEAKDDQTPEEIRDALLGLSDGWLPASAIQGLPVTSLKSIGVFNFHSSISPFAIGYIPPPTNEKWISHNNAVIQRYGAANNDLGSFQPTQLGNRKSFFITYVSSQNQVWIGDVSQNQQLKIHKYVVDRTFGETLTISFANANLINSGGYDPQTDQLWVINRAASKNIYSIFNTGGSLIYRFEKQNQETRAVSYIPAPINEMWVITSDEKIIRWTPQGGYVGMIDLSVIEPRISNPSGMAYIGNDQLMIGDVTSRLVHIFEISQSV